MTQRELGLFADAGATPIHVAAIVALRARSNADGWTRDGLDSLARYALMKPRTLSRALNELQKKKLVDVRRVAHKGGGWTYERRARLDPAVKSLRVEASTTGESAPPHVPTQTASTPAEWTPGDAREDAKTEASGRLATRHNPDVLPDLFPVVDDEKEKIRDAVVELALKTLREELPDLVDEGRARRDLSALRKKRPRVHVIEQIEAWLERGQEAIRGDAYLALLGWLGKAPESETEELAAFCRADGCDEVATVTGLGDSSDAGDFWCEVHAHSECACGDSRVAHSASAPFRCRLQRHERLSETPDGYGRIETAWVRCPCDGFVDARMERAS